MAEQTTPTAESLMEGIGEAVRAGRAPYARLRVDGMTLGYADDRKDGYVLSFSPSIVEGAPKRFQAALENGKSRAKMHVTAKNVKTARALVEWLAKQV